MKEEKQEHLETIRHDDEGDSDDDCGGGRVMVVSDMTMEAAMINFPCWTKASKDFRYVLIPWLGNHC